MPRAALPPTPAPSTEIKGEQSQASLNQAEMGFTLPPSAVNDGSSTASKDLQSHGESVPLSPNSPNTSSEQRQKHQSDLSLPPPPSRSRKIIQMKPKPQPSQPRRSARADAQQSNDKSSATESSQPASVASSKKGASGNTAAGRKVARKTAHSIIERRRRSKMNEEFGVLKDLIPACRGCEMHKLAILQASIDYLRYLEQCVADLKANQEQQEQQEQRQTTSHAASSMQSSPIEAEDSNEDSEDEMEIDEPETEIAKPTERDSSVSSTSAFTAMTSPAFSTQSHHRGSIATLPSPVFGPYFAAPDSLRPSTTHSSHSYAGSRASHSNQTSPNILPLTHSFEHSEDLNEASTALLMLNAKDRRNTVSSLRSTDSDKPSQRSMSVKDLLRS